MTIVGVKFNLRVEMKAMLSVSMEKMVSEVFLLPHWLEEPIL